MKTCVLDGNIILDKEMLHKMLAKQLDFPYWYGKNLDALHDLLTDIPEAEIVIVNQDALYEHLERYASLLMKVLEDAAKEHPGIRWRIAE